MDPASLRRLHASFLAECTDIVGRLTRVILELEGGATGSELHDELGRGLHTLKGTAGSLGLEEASTLAHELEDAYAPVRRGGALSPELVDGLLRGLDRIMEIVRVAASDDATPAPLPEQVPSPEAEGFVEDEVGWRVSPRQIRDLMREVERLRNLRMRVDERRRQLALAIEGETIDRRRLATLARNFGSDGEEAGSIADGIEESIKDIWTIPARLVFEPLERVVRDHCRESGKLAKLSFVGAELALDRRVIEALKSPFVHLIRNAIDHGIEPPEERDAAGKHVAGALAIRLEQQGNMLFVEVSDDGRGLVLERIREVARARGLVSDDRAAALTEAELSQVIFMPGFSTRQDVSATSGRGVGLDVVMTEVRALQGHIEVQSVPGQGTRFLISVPVDLGSSPTLIVRCGELRFGIAIPTIESVFAVRADQVHVGRTRMSLTRDEQTLALVNLAALLGLAHPTAPTDRQAALLVQSRGERIAVIVDEVVGEADVMVRPLPAELRAIAAYQGVATIATGELLLILRSAWLADASRAAQQPIAVSRRALVVDDSVTARALHRAVLEAAGYVVHAAASGRQALEHLRRAAYDVAVCDLAMPEVDGLAFTREVRTRGDTTPIVLVSAHDSAEDRQRGLEAGADAFLSKRECASGRLLAEVAKVIAKRRGSA